MDQPRVVGRELRPRPTRRENVAHARARSRCPCHCRDSCDRGGACELVAVRSGGRVSGGVCDLADGRADGARRGARVAAVPGRGRAVGRCGGRRPAYRRDAPRRDCHRHGAAGHDRREGVTSSRCRRRTKRGRSGAVRTSGPWSRRHGCSPAPRNGSQPPSELHACAATHARRRTAWTQAASPSAARIAPLFFCIHVSKLCSSGARARQVSMSRWRLGMWRR
jgi:hypothetical protein